MEMKAEGAHSITLEPVSTTTEVNTEPLLPGPGASCDWDMFNSTSAWQSPNLEQAIPYAAYNDNTDCSLAGPSKIRPRGGGYSRSPSMSAMMDLDNLVNLFEYKVSPGKPEEQNSHADSVCLRLPSEMSPYTEMGKGKDVGWNTFPRS